MTYYHATYFEKYPMTKKNISNINLSEKRIDMCIKYNPN